MCPCFRPHNADRPRIMPLDVKELELPVAAPLQPVATTPDRLLLGANDCENQQTFWEVDSSYNTGGKANHTRAAPLPDDLSTSSVMNIRYIRKSDNVTAQHGGALSLNDSSRQSRLAPNFDSLPTGSNRSMANERDPVLAPYSKLNERYEQLRDVTSGKALQNGAIEIKFSPTGSVPSSSNRQLNGGIPRIQERAQPMTIENGRPYFSTIDSGLSDMDRWLENVFEQALDGTLLESIDDHRTVSSRIMGGGDELRAQVIVILSVRLRC